MRRAVERLSALVDDLFELVQVDALTIGAETDGVLLGDLMRSAVATVEMDARGKRLDVAVHADGIEHVWCSPHLSRVLQNLLANAVRHTPDGGTVRIDAAMEEGDLRVSVEDTGEGIPPQDVPFVFEPFYRVDVARAGNGTGLGLALADRIVRALGGEIAVVSEPERGSRFTVTLPVPADRALTST